MSNVIRIIFVVIISAILSQLLPTHSCDSLLSVLYTVDGILFSVGIGVATGFDLSRIKNKDYLQRIRMNIASTRNSFICFFIYSTLTLLLSQYLKKHSITFNLKELIFLFDFTTFALCSILFSIVFFIVNFIGLQTLRDQITDRILEETKNK